MSDHPVINMGAIASVLGSLVGWLPPIAAALGIIWYCVLIYDRFFGKRK
jgi:TctA family transporter